MTIERVIKRRSKHKAVYWASPTNAVDGSLAYTAPKEIDCFWRNETENIITTDGREVVSTAVVYVNEDVDEQGMLYLGRLEDLTSSEKSDPRKKKTAYEIKKFIRTPSIAINGTYVRKALL